MNDTTNNPAKPILTVFASFSFGDRPALLPLFAGLRAAGVEVLDFLENEPLGAEISHWVQTHIAEADCILVFISEQSLAQPTWIEREIGLAISLSTDKGLIPPMIVPMLISCELAGKPLHFQPRQFHTGEALGPAIYWNEINCMMPARDGVEAVVERFMRLFTPKIVLITDPEAPDQTALFDSAMRLYADLLPDERERDREVDVAQSLYDSWDETGQADEDAPWLHMLAVLHIGQKVIGVFYCSADRSSGLGFVSFWGLLAAHRAYGRGIQFAQDAIARMKQLLPGLRAIFFAAEQVRWEGLDRFLKDALAIWKRATGQKHPGADWHRRLVEPLGPQPSALEQAIDSASAKRQELIVDELRRFRRFALYANGGNYNRALQRQGIALMGFVKAAQQGQTDAPGSSLMAPFVQPPIRPPVTDANACHLWLFALMLGGAPITAAEAIDWIYDKFLRDTCGQGPTALPGWNEYMVGFKARWRDAFASDAQLSPLRLRDGFGPYNMLLAEVKKHWMRRRTLDAVGGRWDIHL